MHRKVVVKTPVTKMTPSKNKAFNKDLDKYFDYFEIRKDKTPISSPECTFDSPDTVLHTYSGNPAIRINGLVDSPTGMTSGLPPLKTGGDSVNNSGVGGFAYVHSLNEALTPVNGAGSQRSSNIDKNTKKLMEAMQAKMIKLEQENRKLKKEVSDLSSQNKKLQTQVASFITEQENFAKVKDTYEKRVRRLQEHCKTSEDTMSALKRILTLQEEEMVERSPSKQEVTSQQ